MATLTKSAMADRVLEHLGIKAQGQSSSSEDNDRVQEALDSAHDELRFHNMAPFELSAVPEWAQPALRDYVAADVAPLFGVPLARVFGAQASKEGVQMTAKKRLGRQVSGRRHPVPVQVDYF